MIFGPAGFTARLRPTRFQLVFTAFTLFGLAGSAGKAELVCNGRSSHTNLWRRTYDRLPAPWKFKNEVVVREVDDEEMDYLVEQESIRSGHSLGKPELVDGFFTKSRPGRQNSEIVLRDTLSRDESEYVFMHEYGHLIWYSKLPQSLRDEYSRLWERLSVDGRLVTKYAKDDPIEAFAEAFAFFHQRPAELKRADIASYRFLLNVEDYLFQPVKPQPNLKVAKKIARFTVAKQKSGRQR